MMGLGRGIFLHQLGGILGGVHHDFSTEFNHYTQLDTPQKSHVFEAGVTQIPPKPIIFTDPSQVPLDRRIAQKLAETADVHLTPCTPNHKVWKQTTSKHKVITQKKKHIFVNNRAL